MSHAVAAEPTLDDVFGALADPIRRDLLERLADGECTVGELAARHAVSLPAISRHLRVLAAAGLVARRRDGRFRRCRLDAGPLFDATVWLSRYSRYWESQFDTLRRALLRIDDEMEETR